MGLVLLGGAGLKANASIRAHALDERAMSDIVGTMIMLGVTVAVITLVSVQTLGFVSDEESTSAPLDVVATARAGGTSLALLHTGGPTMDLGDLRAVVSVRGAALYDGVIGPAGTTWSLGEPIMLSPLATALAPGDDVAVSLVDVVKGETVATATAHLPLASATSLPAGSFALDVAFDTGTDTTTITPPRSLFVRASLTHPQGRLAVPSVSIDLSALGGPRGVPLLDFGTSGDSLAADGVFSAYAIVPVTATPGIYTVTARAVDLNGAQSTDTGTVVVLDPTGVGGGTGGIGGTSGNGTLGGNSTLGGTGGNGTSGGTGGDGTSGGTGDIGTSGGTGTTGGTGGTGGTGAEGNPNADASHLRLKYNKSLIKAFSHRTLKFEAGSHDRISIFVKIQLVADPIWIWDANSPSANKTDLYRFMPGTTGGTGALGALMADYDWLKPGATEPFMLNDAALSTGTWACRDGATQIYAFREENLTINSFEQERDTLWYYFGATWQRLDASGNLVPGAFHRETISSGGVDEYFVIPRSASSMVIKDVNGFSTTFDNCSF